MMTARNLFVLWIAVGAVLGALLFVAERSRSAKDDPDRRGSGPVFCRRHAPLPVSATPFHGRAGRWL